MEVFCVPRARREVFFLFFCFAEVCAADDHGVSSRCPRRHLFTPARQNQYYPDISFASDAPSRVACPLTLAPSRDTGRAPPPPFPAPRCIHRAQNLFLASDRARHKLQIWDSMLHRSDSYRLEANLLNEQGVSWRDGQGGGDAGSVAGAAAAAAAAGEDVVNGGKCGAREWGEP